MLEMCCSPESVKVPICCSLRTVMDTDMYLVPDYPECPTLYSTSIYLWGLKSMQFELLRKKHVFGRTSWILQAAILEFCVDSIILRKSGIGRVYVPSFMLVSQLYRILAIFCNYPCSPESVKAPICCISRTVRATDMSWYQNIRNAQLYIHLQYIYGT